MAGWEEGGSSQLGLGTGQSMMNDCRAGAGVPGRNSAKGGLWGEADRAFFLAADRLGLTS